MASSSALPTTDLPQSVTSRVDAATGKTYHLDHDTHTTSWYHPRHTHLHEPYTPGVPYPYERQISEDGRAYYLNRNAKTTSWLHPAKLAELQATGILDADTDEYGGEDGTAWKAWILMEIAEEPNKGEQYWVDYRRNEANWQSPEDKKAARQRTQEMGGRHREE